MRTSFVHLADLRLGASDGADPQVFEKGAGQFRFAIDFALDQRASFMVFSGNLLDAADVEPRTFQVLQRGLRRLSEKGASAVAIRGRAELGLPLGFLTWYDMLAQDGLMAVLEPAVGDDGQLTLSRWERRLGAGSYFDLGRCRVLGLRYYGSMIGDLVHALTRAISGLDSREIDFCTVLLHTPLEHFSPDFGAKLAYSDLLMLRRQADHVALGGCGLEYEVEGWAYNPGSAGFYHVSVDTAVEPKHQARYVAYPEALQLVRRQPPPMRVKPSEREDQILDELITGMGGGDKQNTLRDVVRMVRQVSSGPVDQDEVYSRVLEALGRLDATGAV